MSEQETYLIKLADIEPIIIALSSFLGAVLTEEDRKDFAKSISVHSSSFNLGAKIILEDILKGLKEGGKESNKS